MDIVYLSLGMPFDRDTVATQSLGGSESAAYYKAMELGRRGHRVTIFTACEKDGQFENGVRFCAAGPVTQAAPLGERFEHYARHTPHDVLMIQRHPAAYHKRYQAKVCIWETHDLALYRYSAQVNHGGWQTGAVTCVSEWHRQQTLKVYGMDPGRVHVVPNGVDLSLYECPPERPQGFSGKFLLLYQSRPERGLEHLVRPGGIMSRLKTEAPDAHLLVAGYANTQPAMAAYYDKLRDWATACGNVTYVEPLSKPRLAALQKACDLMVYPTEFEEVSCITAMEAMAAGLPMIASECAALPETCGSGSGTHLLALKDGKADEDAFVALIATRKPDVQAASQFLQTMAANHKTWARAVDALETVIDGLFAETRNNLPATLRHCIDHGDIMLAKELALDAPGEIAALTRRELHDLYSFTLEKPKYAAHYRHHQAKYYDELEDRVIGEDVTNTMRFQGVAMYLVREAMAQQGRALRVMDYGCAHGHYTLPIAKHYKDWRFTGVDISGRAIAAATRWVQRDGLGNIEFYVGDDTVFNDITRFCPLVQVGEEPGDEAVGGPVPIPEPVYARDLFDVILAGEVLEHVPDPVALLNKFTKFLRPGGVIIVTTPTGRWEWSGHEAFKTGREHLWHLERADIEEMCEEVEVDISFAPARNDESGEMLGSWVWAARVHTGDQFVAYNRERKLKYLAPRQTIGAALIVKDGERTLRKSLDSIGGWVDQVVIAVDPTTTDATRDVIARWARDNPWTPLTVMDGVSAIEAGFDAARNLTLERLETDWCLWFDADEEMQRPFSLWQFARPSLNGAFGLPQVHYSCDPPQVLTTDFPCRFFRRNGVKFYGVVHEHPEKELGKAIPHSAIRHEAQFLHSGYVDEGTRRKRFMRNLPLLHRDLAAYPDRGLNRFLWLRDIAQGIGFELEQTAGQVLEGQPERAQKGIEIFEQMVDKDPPRMLVDAMQYYSHCVLVHGGGFEANISMKLKTDVAPDLAVSLDVQGRFHSREFYFKFMRRLQEETTKHYEDKHL